jgi:thiol-disulfide isomerase/thioredoxin
MIMKHVQWTILVFLLLGISLPSEASPGSQFFNGGLLEAKKLAEKEGKLILINFYADWCMPCKWMDQNTYTDPSVESLMKSKYISIKVNIDEAEGFELSQKYEIQVLPTLLFFNKDGLMLDRVEETLAAKNMVVLLNRHNNENTKSPITHSINTSPKEHYIQKDKDITATKKNTSSYKLQMGVFTHYENVAAKVSELQDLFLEPIVVVNEVVEHKVFFKILLGHFYRKEDASLFKEKLLKEYQMDAIIL